ncbi:glycosyltransferase family 4 protein [Winogradskyella sediminis]|uniref:Glycosyltransferase involved in cell wall bisynthesis n=1 Tax=Winogradskyella sediminis TaxID=1382466 RepID=A0A1H1PV31_9FLAO|nr:glycosyltransferase family 4 protein [Winogradskyella sediminis]SDS14867.1 Glycosyltransferase involved in cell wall bisynthesis [Winogradskyella sediminis]
MKILHYVDTFSRLSETFIYDLLNLLQSDSKNSGIQHLVLCHQRENIDIRPIANVYEISFGYTKFRRLQIKFGINKWEIPSINQVHEFISAQNPDIIHAHFGHSGVRMWSYLDKFNKKNPLIVQCHGTDVISKPHFDAVYLNLLRKIGNRPKSRFIGNTDFLCNTIKEIGIPGSKVEKVTYSLNQSFRENLETTIDSVNDKINFEIIAVGRLIKWKGHKYLIDAIHNLYSNGIKKLNLTIIGDGEEMEALKNQVSELGLTGVITFKGAVSHLEVKQALLKHDLLVQPSMIDEKTKQRESFGLTILEAIACGVPVIVTDTGGMPELVGANTPFSKIVTPASSESLAQAIKFFIENPRNLKEMKEYTEDRLNTFSQTNQLNSLYKIYNDILDEG